jgi:hypothetical protein
VTSTLPVTPAHAHPPRPRRFAALLALFALGFGLQGCVLGSAHLEVPLFFEYDPEPEETWTTFPFILSGKKQVHTADEERYYGLWPLFKYVREGREREFKILGASVYQQRYDHRGFEDLDMILGPVLYGNSADEGRYLSILPFGGTTKGILGKDFGIFATPLFMYFEDETSVGTMKSWHAPFPFVNVVRGGGRQGGRFWPFYAHYERYDDEGHKAYDRQWIMFPFFTWQKNNLNSGDHPGAREQWMWFAFPFAGRAGGPNTSQWTVMWPFFRYFEDRRHTDTTPYWEIRAPFPLFIYGEGKNRERLDLWPFFGYKERRVPLNSGGYMNYYRNFAAWPVWRYEVQSTDRYEDTKWFALPLLWSYHRENKQTGESTRTFKLWPLFRYKQHGGGRTTVNVLSPLWFNDPEGAFEQIYNPLTAIYDHTKTDKEERLKLLWGLYMSHETAEDDDMIIHPFLFWDWEKKDGSKRDVAFLFGLFRYVRRGDYKALRFFWLPEFPSWGGEDPEAESDSDSEAEPAAARPPEAPMRRSAMFLPPPARRNLQAQPARRRALCWAS